MTRKREFLDYLADIQDATLMTPCVFRLRKDSLASREEQGYSQGQ